MNPKEIKKDLLNFLYKVWVKKIFNKESKDGIIKKFNTWELGKYQVLFIFTINSIMRNWMTMQPNICIIILFILILINSLWECKPKFLKWRQAWYLRSLMRMRLELSQVAAPRVLLWPSTRIKTSTKTALAPTCNFIYLYFSVVPNSVHAAVDKGCFYFNI